ncbi:Uncharacterized protein TCM_004786 [Theobroma cacao]|uniref:Uncharacterized protein n=1 Tax=Theobroma cacao TaxID=3641 RepID=A0A061DT41_THECC|nr:Uncharacterized protein TCM_004786 [Theobroma cacao]
MESYTHVVIFCSLNVKMSTPKRDTHEEHVVVIRGCLAKRVYQRKNAEWTPNSVQLAKTAPSSAIKRVPSASTTWNPLAVPELAAAMFMKGTNP